ncbi:MAG: DUF4363 family protein [Eubacteriales bacterium]
MKAFLIALCVLLIICSGVTISAVHISHACEDLEQLVRDFPALLPDDGNHAEFNAVLDQFNAVWLRHRRIMRFTVGHTETDTIDDLLADLTIRYTHHDDAGYANAKVRLLSSIQRLRSSERFSADSVF